MNKPGMIRLETAHYSNLIGAVQRTGSLTGGAIRQLPGGVVVDGLVGVSAFPSAIAEAQKEFQLGRPRQSLEKIRQLETTFSALSGRWNSTVQSLISGARQGRQGIALAKLNELKQAQTRMQQLVGPANKAFRDLLTALEHEITMEGRQPDHSKETSSASSSSPEFSEGPQLPTEFIDRFEIETRLELKRGNDKKTRVVPQLETRNYYLISEEEQYRVVQAHTIEAASLHVMDASNGSLLKIDGKDLIDHIKKGTWLLTPKASET